VATGNASAGDSSRARGWIILGAIVIGQALFNFIFEPLQGGKSILRPLTLGAAFVQPPLFAMWAVLGPPPAAKRWPLTIAAFIMIVYAGAMSDDKWLSLEYATFAVGFWVMTSLLMAIIAKLGGLRLSAAQAASGAADPLNQFGLKYLLVITAICAVLLGIGRSLASPLPAWNPTWELGYAIRGLIASFGFILLATLPAIVAPMLIVSRPVRPAVLMALLLSWAGLSWMAVETIAALEGDPRWEIAGVVASLQLGAAANAVVSAALVRIAGYRLRKRMP
jgi:hypothetical protein